MTSIVWIANHRQKLSKSDLLTTIGGKSTTMTLCGLFCSLACAKVSLDFHKQCPRALSWNPRYTQLVTAEARTVLWLPQALK